MMKQREVFFAFYAYEGVLLMVADGRKFDLTNAAIRVRRTWVAPFVKKFSIYDGDVRVATWTYWFSDLSEDGFIPKDILNYIAREIAPRGNHRKYTLFWEESATGRDPTRSSFQDELQRLLQSAG